MTMTPHELEQLRQWAVKVNKRLKALEELAPKPVPKPDAVELMGLGFKVQMRRKELLTQAQLEAKMVRNDATPDEAAKNAAEIMGNVAKMSLPPPPAEPDPDFDYNPPFDNSKLRPMEEVMAEERMAVAKQIAH